MQHIFITCIRRLVHVDILSLVRCSKGSLLKDVDGQLLDAGRALGRRWCCRPLNGGVGPSVAAHGEFKRYEPF